MITVHMDFGRHIVRDVTVCATSHRDDTETAQSVANRYGAQHYSWEHTS